MTNTEPKPTGSGKEIALLVGVLLLVGAGTIGTYWVRTRGAEASGETTRPRVTAPPPTADTEIVHADVYFDFKSTRLRADAVRLLQDKAALMERTSTWVVLLQGYTDTQGPAEYNRRLAQQRADTVRQFLIELGVVESGIKVVTVGADGALCDEPSKDCQQLNRRVHLEMRRLTRTTAAPVRPALAVGDVLQTRDRGAQQP